MSHLVAFLSISDLTRMSTQNALMQRMPLDNLSFEKSPHDILRIPVIGRVDKWLVAGKEPYPALAVLVFPASVRSR